MTTRERRLLVLSPHVRSREQAERYRPCGGKPLLEILRDVAAGIFQCQFRQWDHHAVCEFFLGDLPTRALSGIPISLVDCEICRSDEAAAHAARTALSEFTGSVILAGNDTCAAPAGFNSRLARSDEALFAYLFIDLCGPWFSRIGEQLARRWRD